jgi:hypothetical protein
MSILVENEAICENCGKQIYGFASGNWYHYFPSGDSRCNNYSDDIIASPIPITIQRFPGRTLEEILNLK